MCSRCFIPPPSHPPSFPWPAPLVPIASPFPRRPSPAALALQRSPRRSRSSLELEQSRCTGAALAGSCLAKPSSRECPPRTDHPTRSGHRVSPCSPMSKHGAAGVTHGAYTSMPQHPRRVPSAHTDTVVAPLGDTSESQLSKCPVQTAGHGMGQQCPFEATEIYACPEMFC